MEVYKVVGSSGDISVQERSRVGDGAVNRDDGRLEFTFLIYTVQPCIPVDRLDFHLDARFCQLVGNDLARVHMHLVVGRNADLEGQVLLSRLFEQFLCLFNIYIIDICQFIVEIFFQSGNDRCACLGTQPVADLVNDLLRVYRIGNSLADAHILEGLKLIVEGQKLDRVGVA